MRILCIYNPHAGGGKSTIHLEEVKQLFEKYKIDAQEIFSA